MMPPDRVSSFNHRTCPSQVRPKHPPSTDESGRAGGMTAAHDRTAVRFTCFVSYSPISGTPLHRLTRLLHGEARIFGGADLGWRAGAGLRILEWRHIPAGSLIHDRFELSGTSFALPVRWGIGSSHNPTRPSIGRYAPPRRSHCRSRIPTLQRHWLTIVPPSSNP